METANKCNNKHILYTYDRGDESQVHSREYKNIPTSGIESSRVRWVILVSSEKKCSDYFLILNFNKISIKQSLCYQKLLYLANFCNMDMVDIS